MQNQQLMDCHVASLLAITDLLSVSLTATTVPNNVFSAAQKSSELLLTLHLRPLHLQAQETRQAACSTPCRRYRATTGDAINVAIRPFDYSLDTFASHAQIVRFKDRTERCLAV
jgi:hypothetical protein